MLRNRMVRILLMVFAVIGGCAVVSPVMAGGDDSGLQDAASESALLSFQAAKQVNTLQELKDAIDAAPDNETAYGIEIMSDIALEEELYIAKGKHIQIGSASPRIISAAPGRRLLNVSGTLDMEEHIVLQGDAMQEITGMGGGVYIDDEGVFIMNGGKIRGNRVTDHGGGVCAYGTFTMNGGQISGNDAGYGGGVYVYGTFTMNGGRIFDNAGAVPGHDVYVYQSAFIMNGGEINKKDPRQIGGVYISDYGTFTMNGGQINGDDSIQGSGVYARGEVFLNGGKISGKAAMYSSGAYGNSLYITYETIGAKTIVAETIAAEDESMINEVFAMAWSTIGSIVTTVVILAAGGLLVLALGRVCYFQIIETWQRLIQKKTKYR